MQDTDLGSENPRIGIRRNTPRGERTRPQEQAVQRPWGSGTSAGVLGGAQVGRFVAGATGAKGQNVQDAGVWGGDEAGLKTRAPEPAFLSLSCGGRDLSFIRDCSLQGAGSPEPSRIQRYLGGRCRSGSGILEVAVCVGPDSGILGRGGGEGIIRTSTPAQNLCVCRHELFSVAVAYLPLAES